MTPTRAHRGRGDGAAILLEFALVLPLLAMLAFAVAEVGLAFTAENRVQGAVSQAARVGASGGAQVEADRDILLALKAALPADDLAGLQRVVVFRATAADGAVPAACKQTANPSSEAGQNPGSSATAPACNTYTGSTVRALTKDNYTASGFSSGTSCASTNKDRYWCPRTRKDSRADPPDWIGVWVFVNHDNPIPFYFGDMTFEKSSIYRVQPDAAG